MIPPLIIKSKPVDFELCKLLGEGYGDFIVICANGEQVPFLGTPYDSPGRREAYPGLIAWLNDRSRGDWPEMFTNWKRQFCEHYKLPTETKAEDFWPEFSFAISRVCHGYSEHLHAAIGLFDRLGDKAQSWRVERVGGNAGVEIVDCRGKLYRESGTDMAALIATAVRALLIEHK